MEELKSNHLKTHSARPQDRADWATQVKLIEEEYGPIQRMLLIQVGPGAAIETHTHLVDIVMYYPEQTYDGWKGYRFIPKGLEHGVPENKTDETRNSVYFSLAGTLATME